MFLHRSQHTQIALNSPGIVIADVAPNHLNKLLLTGKTPAIIAFPFQDAPETFHRAIVNTVCHAGHALHHSRLYKFLVECSACILVASVTVEQRTCVWIELNSPVKGLEYERIVIALTQRIGHDAPVTEVQNSAQIELMYLNNRKYTRLKILEPEIVEMKKAGRTKREIADYFGLTKEQIKDLLKRYQRRERKIAAGLSPKPVGRSRKDAQPHNKEAEQAYEIARLKMENKLLRDFLQSTGRK